MNQKFIPELGMMGSAYGKYACPEFIKAGLDLLADRIEAAEWNRTQREFIAPTKNAGTHYSTDVFEMHSYYWGDLDEGVNRPNFKCGDFEVRWYKYCGRGMSMNQDIDANTFFEIVSRCMESVNMTERDYTIIAKDGGFMARDGDGIRWHTEREEVPETVWQTLQR